MIPTIEYFLEQEIYPIALELDRDFSQLKAALLKLGHHHWLGLKIPPSYGGHGYSAQDYASIQIALTRASGILAFVQTQHQSCGAIIAQGDNVPLQQQYLPAMVEGKTLMGISFSHLRRSGSPMVVATSHRCGGYELNGVLPWITGYGLFQKILIAATLKTGEELYGLVNFENSETMELSPPMELVTFAVAQTVKARLHNLILKPEQIVKIDPPGQIHRRDRANVLSGAPFCLGCSQRAIEVMKQLMLTNAAEASIQEQLHRTEQLWLQFHHQLIHEIAADNHGEQNGQKDEAHLQLRAQIINFMFHCVQQLII
ncbi:MAG: acyl-CoA/acyl-ACP dehydrogenase [Synechococcaceae cyanobacterium RL_1_2]|nr:acyl-CoA/acyl-ACP dehydrogenase [Synechococcaceae cyanobacterium RL_1_2]